MNAYSKNSFKDLQTLLWFLFLGFFFCFFFYSSKCIITEKDYGSGLRRFLRQFLHPTQKQILQLNNLMARIFWFHKEVMDLDVKSACSHFCCAG